MELLKVKRHFQITLPIHIRKKYNIVEGDYVEVEAKDGGILVRPVKVVHPDQEYFFSKEWQEGEAEADKDIAEGRVAGPFESVEDLMKDLES